MAPSSPTVARWELALRIKARRDELGLSVSEITSHLGFSRNYWSAVENERSVLADDKFDALMKLMEFDDETVEELRALHATSRERGWWADYPSLNDETRRIFGLETGATEIRAFESLIVPGLLQTREYASAYYESDPMFRLVDVEDLVDIRMRRQQRLGGADQLRFIALVSEAILHQHVGPSDVHRQQLEHLVKIGQSSLKNVEIRVLPFEIAPGPLIGSSTLLLMRFASEHLPELAWQESIRPLGIIEDSDEMTRLTFAFEEGLRRSLSAEESISYIEDVLDRGSDER